MATSALAKSVYVWLEIARRLSIEVSLREDATIYNPSSVRKTFWCSTWNIKLVICPSLKYY